MTNQTTACYHCGEDLAEDQLNYEEKDFCCHGCKTVFKFLNDQDLCDYYQLENNTPGTKLDKAFNASEWAFLELEEVLNDLYIFHEGNFAKTKLFIPVIHCSSCIWLLEQLHKIHPGVNESTVNFVKRTVTISFNTDKTSLRKIVETLHSIGYKPDINLANKNKDTQKNHRLIYQLGVAGFCFGNIMLLSFPDYLGDGLSKDPFYLKFFNYLSWVLSLPVLLYCSADYFKSAWGGLRSKIINIDVPIVLGILVLFTRSTFDVFLFETAGYLDSLACLLFFLLIGKWYQSKTYQAFSFERDYQSYFPMAVTKLNDDGSNEPVYLSKLKIGDRLLIRNGEIIPTDARLIKGNAQIDYSFVTGESDLVQKNSGENIFAGGRQTGEAIELLVDKKVEQSYLTELWNKDLFKKQESTLQNMTDRLSKYFTLVLLIAAAFTALYWWKKDPLQIWNNVTAVLIVACPCALALALPFGLGNAMRWLGRKGFYLKNVDVVEKLHKIDHIVFDKTGTITLGTSSEVRIHGTHTLDKTDYKIIKSIVHQSMHPLSRLLDQKLDNYTLLKLDNFKEYTGKGIEAWHKGNHWKIGSSTWLNIPLKQATSFAVSCNEQLVAEIELKTSLREGITSLIKKLKHKFSLALLSGDSEREKSSMEELFPTNELLFNQQPEDKLIFIEKKQKENAHVLMVGDGLNDAGALKQADVGISVSENIYGFTPSSDGILQAENLAYLNTYMAYSRQSIVAVKWSYVLSIAYNSVGIYLAFIGVLSPLTAAILMPLSSVTVVSFVSIYTALVAKRMLTMPNSKHVDY